MLSPVLWRRSATAIGIYGATGLGIAGMVIASRELGTVSFGEFAIVTSASAFFQLLLDLTVEDALVKFGFRYSTAEDWPRLRRLFDVALRFKLTGGLLAAICLLIAAPLSSLVWKSDHLALAFVVVAPLPLIQAPENVYGSAIMLRGRYDLRSYFLLIAMALRLIGVAVGAHFGVWQAVLGMLVAQVLATAAITWGGYQALLRFPRPAAAPLLEHARELRNFVVSSTISSTLVSMRGTLSTLVVGAAAPVRQAGFFRIAQAPLTAFNALSSPARLVLLTEQTRDFEQGRHDKMYRMLKRYIAATTVLMAVAIPLLWWAMPWLVKFVSGAKYGPAAEPARVLLLGAAIQFIFGWTKSFPVSIGRPNLRLGPQIVEIATLVPLTVVCASRWGATGAAVAAVIASAVFASVWCVLLIRIRRERLDVVAASA
jgi:O-antigen/teichoic acid export membrane protein